MASQKWNDLVFLHWRVDSSVIAPLLPQGTRPDEFDGSSWVGLIGFTLADATMFGSPPIPYFGTFVEVNVRLYAVDEAGRRGVVFVSLEAARLAAVIAARASFSLPYFWAATGVIRNSEVLTYRSVRHGSSGARTEMAVRQGERAVIGNSLADFLTARWALFARRGAHTMYLPNEHEPWSLFDAELISLEDTLLEVGGIPGLVARAPDSVLYSPGVTALFGRGSRL